MTDYRRGYSIGVGGIVVYDARVLMIRYAYGEYQGSWSFPRGYVEPGETIDCAIVREVHEEANVTASVDGIIAVRQRVLDTENSAFFTFRLSAASDACAPDHDETDAASFMTADEIQQHPDIHFFSKRAALQVLAGDETLLRFMPDPRYPDDQYVTYA